MLNQYETVFIVTPVLSEPQMKETVQKFRNLITGNGGKIVNEEDKGLRKLAYPIQKKTTGFYSLFEFQSNTSFINKLETEYKRDERIIRFLTIKLDKYAIEYNLKKRSIANEKPEKPAAAEKTSHKKELPEDKS